MNKFQDYGYILNIKFLDESNIIMINHYLNFKYANSGDSGIDLLNLNNLNIKSFENKIIKFGIKAEMIDLETNENCNYMIIPRSSISKTNFQMINSIEYINNFDNDLQVCIKNISNDESLLEENKCYFQIISPSLKPIKINIINTMINKINNEKCKLILNIVLDNDIKYFMHYAKYNNKILYDLDLLNPNDLYIESYDTQIINFNIITEMINILNKNKYNFYIIQKYNDLINNNFQIVNSIEICDMASFNFNKIIIKNITNNNIKLIKNETNFKIVSSTFESFKVNIELKLVFYNNIIENKYILKIKLINTSKNIIDFYNNKTYISGMDLLTPNDITVDSLKVETLKFGFKAEMINIKTNECVSYLLLPMHLNHICHKSDNNLILANSIGLIDAGYRGELMAKIRNISDNTYMLLKDNCHYRIIAPNIKSFNSILVNELECTERSDGAFGSTTKKIDKL
jgi:dUTP pyrophosphatase